MRGSLTWFLKHGPAVRDKWGELVASTRPQDAPAFFSVDLVCCRIAFETGGNPRAVSRPQQWASGVGGEMGLLQLSPDTRAAHGLTDKQALDPGTNLRIGQALWLRWYRSWADWALAKRISIPHLQLVPCAAACWLVTSIGPGAMRWLTRSLGGDVETWPAYTATIYRLGEHAGTFGRQSASLIKRRIRVALAAARAAAHMVTGPGMLAAMLIAGVVS